MPITRDKSSGKFAPSYTQADINEIRGMIQEGKTRSQISLAIMKARGVTEATSWRWIRLARGEEVGAYAKKTD